MATKIENNAAPSADRVRLSYSQMVLLPGDAVMYSLDTTDRGGQRSLAKRWFRWFTTPAAILGCVRSTENMRAKANAARTKRAA